MNRFYAIVLLMVGLAGAQVIEFSQTDWHCGAGTLGPVDDWGCAYYSADSVIASNGVIILVRRESGYDPTAWVRHDVMLDTRVPKYIQSLRPADLDGDGDNDIAAVLTDGVYWFEQAVPYGFVLHLIATVSPAMDYIHASTAAFPVDIDGDGDIDIVAGGCRRSFVGAAGYLPLTWYENNGTASVWTAHAIGTNGVNYIDCGDIDNDGNMDIVTAENGAASLVAYFGDGTGGFTSVNVASGPWRVVLADFDDDGYLDIVYDYIGMYEVIILHNTDGRSFTPAYTLNTIYYPDGLWANDYDEDGDLDVVSAGFGGGDYFEVITNNGGFSFTHSNIITGAYHSADGAMMVDVDLDGLTDILGVFRDVLFFRRTDLSTFSPVNIDHLTTYYDTDTTFHWIYGGNWEQVGDCSPDVDMDIIVGGTGHILLYENQMVSEFAGRGELTSSVLSAHLVPNTLYRCHLFFDGCAVGGYDVKLYGKADASYDSLLTKEWEGPTSVFARDGGIGIELPLGLGYACPGIVYVQYKIEIERRSALPSEVPIVNNVWVLFTPYQDCGVSVSLCGDASLCVGDSTALRVFPDGFTGGLTYIWGDNFGNSYSGDSILVVSPFVSTVYGVTVVDSLGCCATDSVGVSVHETIVPDVVLVYPPNGGVLEHGDVTLIWRSAGAGVSYDVMVGDSVLASLYPDTEYTIAVSCHDTIRWAVIPRDICTSIIPVCDGTGAYDTLVHSVYGDTAVSMFTTYPCIGPIAQIVLPHPHTISACVEQEIWITIVDTEGVDWETVELRVKGVFFDWSSGYLSHRGDTLMFTPPDNFWVDGESVYVELLRADDIYGSALQNAPLVWSFWLDFSAPAGGMSKPIDMVREVDPTLELWVLDALSGTDPDSIRVSLPDYDAVFTIDDFSYTADTNGLGGRIDISLGERGIRLIPGDTVLVLLYRCDSPDTCGPNCRVDSFTFRVEPVVPCDVQPNPFTPNNDDVNEIAIFSYPWMFSDVAHLSIYTRRRELVYERSLGPVDSWSDAQSRLWDGLDKTNTPARPGVYLYIIDKNGEVVCEGTIVLTR